MTNTSHIAFCTDISGVSFPLHFEEASPEAVLAALKADNALPGTYNIVVHKAVDDRITKTVVAKFSVTI